MIETKDLFYTYSSTREVVLKKINISIEENRLVALLGPNGSGKTTLLKILSGILSDYTGSVKLLGVELKRFSPRDLARTIAYVPQTENLSMPYTVYEYVLMGRTPYIGLVRISRRDLEKTTEAIKMVGLEDLVNRRINELSGGEAQLARISRALAQEPRVILLDEPTSHLDLRNRVKVLRLIRDLSRRGYTVIFTTHDPNEALRVSDEIYVLNKGSIVAQGPPAEVIDKELIKKVYSVDVEIFGEGEEIFVYPLI